MTTTKTKAKLWPPIHKLEYASGAIGWQVACMVKGRRIREAYPTKERAELRAQELRTQRAAEGTSMCSLSPRVRAEASQAAEQLAAHGASIAEAATYYLDHVLKYRNAPITWRIIAKLLADAKSNHRRERTVKDLRQRLRTFGQTFGKRRIAEIDRGELKAWLQDPTLSARSRINYGVKISQLFNYAIANDWAEHNVAASIPRPDAEDKEPEVFTVEQAARLLEHAADHDLLAYVALGLFAGLRSAEINRLDWSNVKLTEGSIVVGATVAKKRSRRVVEINDTLAAWLPLCAKTKGPVVPLDSNRTLYARLAKLATAAGLDHWPGNGLRHSSASYSLAASGDAVRVAYALGNSADMIHRHYKALVTKPEAERFWGLRPATDADNKVLPMAANA